MFYAGDVEARCVGDDPIRELDLVSPRRPCSLDLAGIGGSVVEVAVWVVVRAVVPGELSAGDDVAEPVPFDLGHVAQQAEERHVRWFHRASSELRWVESVTLRCEILTVFGEEVHERGALVGLGGRVEVGIWPVVGAFHPPSVSGVERPTDSGELDPFSRTLSAWSGLRLVRPITEGNRNVVWQAELRGEPVAVRASRRRSASLSWELDLIALLAGRGLRVPQIMPADGGRRSVDGVVVQRWLDGRPPDGPDDWRLVAESLARVHAVDVGQRPGADVVTRLSARSCSVDANMSELPGEVASVILGVFATMADAPVGLIHGDPGSSNIRIDADGRVGLLDWDESRIDLTWHDLSNLGVQVLADEEHARASLLSHAWEAANAWTAEPEYARARFEQLLVEFDRSR